MADIYEAIQKFTMEVNNKIEDFIVKEVNNATGDIGIVIDAQKIAEAVQKQIPKKPIYNHHCPSCEKALPNKKITDKWCECCFNWKYCPDCGQRLDWEV